MESGNIRLDSVAMLPHSHSPPGGLLVLLALGTSAEADECQYIRPNATYADILRQSKSRAESQDIQSS